MTRCPPRPAATIGTNASMTWIGHQVMDTIDSSAGGEMADRSQADTPAMFITTSMPGLGPPIALWMSAANAATCS